MNSADFNTHEKFKNFPPLYTEQVNEVTLSKQLDIWHKLISDEFSNNGKLHTLGIHSVELAPFKNAKIARNVNVSFLALILEYLVQKQYAFYLHPLHHFCKKNNVTIWGALFHSRNCRGYNLSRLHEDYTRSLVSTPRKAPVQENQVQLLKKRRDSLMKSNYTFGVFPYPVSDMAETVLQCIKKQCDNNKIETVYYIFYNKKECNRDFNKFPEDHLAFLLSYLCYTNKIALSFNESMPPNSLNNKNVSIQLV